MATHDMDRVNNAIVELQTQLKALENLGVMYFEGMCIGWVGADRRPRQDRYRPPLRAVMRHINASKKRCGTLARQAPLAPYFRQVSQLLHDSERAPFPEDSYPQLMAVAAEGCKAGQELLVSSAAAGDAPTELLRQLRLREWQEYAARAARCAAAACDTWSGARLHNAFERVSGYSPEAPRCSVVEWADCWLELCDTLRAVGLGGELQELRCDDTPACVLASTLLCEYAAEGRRDDLIKSLTMAHQERWDAIYRIHDGLRHLGRNARRRVKWVAVADQHTDAPAAAEDGPGTDVLKASGEAHLLQEVAGQITLLDELDRRLLLELNKRGMTAMATGQPSQLTLAGWLGCRCNSSFKGRLAGLVKSLLIGNLRHDGENGGYYLTERGSIAFDLIRKESSPDY